MYNSVENRDKLLSKYATKNIDTIKLAPEVDDIRTPFFRDIDKIIYTLSYVRYIDKTQVFSYTTNDHISKRMIHVQLVSKIARTIGRALGLNEDLIEAQALGHDLGHVPFGHVGERILSKLSRECGEGYFNHNIQSVRTLLYLENSGLGVNISLQTLDGIMCHNGEILSNVYKPHSKTKIDFFNEYESSYKYKDAIKNMVPMTMEGCVVRISDIIGYIGRDLEEAILLNIINKNDIPQNIIQVLGSTNSKIVNTIVNDIIQNSINKPYIKMSNEVYEAIRDLKKFNYENIYLKANTQQELEHYDNMFRKLFNYYLDALKKEDKNNSIYKVFLNNMNEEYYKNNTYERIVIDYIAGMTDDYFTREYNNIS